PAAQNLVTGIVGLQTSTAAVRHLAGWLAQQEAVVRRCGKNSPATAFAGDGGVVEVGVKTEERQLEAILAACLAVARTGVAACSRQDGLDVALEGNRQEAIAVDHLDGGPSLLAVEGGDDRACAVG